MTRVDALVVAVPARDEELLLPACLRAVDEAARLLRAVRPGIRVAVAVALDGCTDGSAAVAGAHDVTAATLPGLNRVPEAEAWVKQHRAEEQEKRPVKPNIEAGAVSSSSQTQRNTLFQQFIEWKRAKGH